MRSPSKESKRMHRMERFSNGRGLSLAADYFPGSRKGIVMAHGFTGDRHEWGRFTAFAEAFNDAGYSVLTFDFSGCGESDDDTITLAKQIDDLEHAIRHIRSKGAEEIGLFGHSLGALVCAYACTKDIVAMVWTAPVTQPTDIRGRYTQAQLRELEKKGYLTKRRKMGARRELRIDRQMLQDREKIDTEAVLARIKCPVCIIHGTRDESVPLADSYDAITRLPEGSKLIAIPDADHYYEPHLEKFVRTAAQWFSSHL